MSLLHPAILYGLGLAAIPVILHLLLRQKPKRLLFPALRLIQNRRQQNVRRLRLRHLLLLSLRIAVIGAFVFAIARPSVPAADYSLNGRELVTLLVVVGAAIAAYYGMSHHWRKQALPKSELSQRQSRLRSGSIAAAILLTLLAVVWPYQRRISAELKSPAPPGDLTLPVAAVFLFDTSLSMEYQQEGKTRLDVAREVALAHLSDLPSGSRVAVADVASDHPMLFQSTLAGAKVQMESREPHPVRLPLNDRIRAALRLHEDDRERVLAEQAALPEDRRSDRYLRRIYVLTDLARSAWRLGGTSRLAGDLERLPAVKLFLIDVGQTDPPNLAVVEAGPLRPRVTIGSEAYLRATVTRTGGDGAQQFLELLLDDGTGRAIKVDQQPVQPVDGQPHSVEFKPQVIASTPIVHGQVRLVSSDPAPFDDVRYFTIQSRPPISVLTVAPRGHHADAWKTALEVQGYKTTVSAPEQLSRLKLTDYEIVCLINVPALENRQWHSLGQFVESGGGLAVFLGSDAIVPSNYGGDQPQVFLPGSPQVHTAPGARSLRVVSPQHPLVQALGQDDSLSLLESSDVERFWRVSPALGAATIFEYDDHDRTPALLERRHGRGRVLMFTTAVDIKGVHWQEWNMLPNPSGPVFAFLAFADEMMRHLARDSEVQLTYQAGDQPRLSLPEQPVERAFLLQQPGFRQTRLTLPAGESLLVVPDADELGQYNLKPADGSAGVVAGFSLNPPPGESDFTRASAEELDQLLGAGRYQVARSIGELQEEINIADLGRELFPLVLAAALVIFLAEHFLANWFYDNEPGTVEDGIVRGQTSSPTARPELATSAELTS